MKNDEKYTIKKLPVSTEKTRHLPLWFNHFLYNEMMPRQEQSYEAKDDPTSGGYHFFRPLEKPLSSCIDFSKMDTND